MEQSLFRDVRDYPDEMPVFVTLPSGLIINLGLVRRVASTDHQGESGLSVYFSSDDVMLLGAEDAKAFRRRLGATGAMASSAKIVTFWLVIVAALVLVYLSVSTHH
jgi:hypothetical protein